jgi:hypothetical protein
MSRKRFPDLLIGVVIVWFLKQLNFGRAGLQDYMTGSNISGLPMNGI